MDNDKLYISDWDKVSNPRLKLSALDALNKLDQILDEANKATSALIEVKETNLSNEVI